MFDIHGFEMTVFKLLIGVTLIVLHLRLTCKQQTVQLTPIDFIGNFILGGIIGGVIYNQAFSFAEYISFLLVTFGIISGLNYLTSKFMSTRSLVMGKATGSSRAGDLLMTRSTARITNSTQSSFSQSYAAWASFTERHQPRTTRSQRFADRSAYERRRRELPPGVERSDCQ